MLLAHNVRFDLGSVVETAEFGSEPVLALDFTVERLTLDKQIPSLEASLIQREEFQIQFTAQ